MNRVHLVILLIIMSTLSWRVASTPYTQEQLPDAIDQILHKTNTKGVAVVMIEPNGLAWSYVSGQANVDTNKAVTTTTQFRLGSISKMFVAMSVMKLVEQGQLSLDDSLRALAPEIEFTNPWQSTNPITMAHLIEHTTGWDAPHFSELAHNSSLPISTLDALALHPHSRTSRWVPGSRMSYNNTGPVVAAYIVEKITGMGFEQFVKQTFLVPLGMQSTDYFYTDNYKNNAAMLYRGNQPQPYAHLAYRASGALNSNLLDMTSFARFLLSDKGEMNTGILSTHSFNIMEKPYSSLAANAGLELGFGLGTTMFHQNGYLFYGHEGAMRGANSLIAYSPELGVAHVIMANSESPAVTEIHQLLSAYESQKTQREPLMNDRSFTGGEINLSAFYRPVAPISHLSEAVQNLLPWKLQINHSNAWIKPLLGGKKRELIASTEGQFKQNTTGKVALVQGQDPLLGKVLYYGTQTFKKVTVLEAYLPIIILALWLLCALISLVFLFVWLPRFLLKKIENRAAIQIRIWPLISILLLVLSILMARHINNSLYPFDIAASVNFYSLFIFLMTLGFALTSLWSGYVVIKNKQENINRFVFWHSFLLTLTNISLTFYLGYYGFIGIQLWA